MNRTSPQYVSASYRACRRDGEHCSAGLGEPRADRPCWGEVGAGWHEGEPHLCYGHRRSARYFPEPVGEAPPGTWGPGDGN
ncbi:MAG TPA: hypothetical protein VEB21_02045 [Terriglobales bacterium]|nr:hypothetical protein [Terriglobales bacterium]